MRHALERFEKYNILVGKSEGKESTLEEQVVDERIILQRTTTNRIRGCGLDYSVSD
jgi:hypothetical protein